MNVLRMRRKRLVRMVTEVERLSRLDRQTASAALHCTRVDERLPRAALSSVLSVVVELALLLTPRHVPAGLVAEPVVRDARSE